MRRPKDLRAEAAAARAQAAKLMAYAQLLDAAADAADGVQVTSGNGYGTVTNMESTVTPDERPTRTGPPATSGPANAAAAMLGLRSMGELAKILNEKSGTVRQWNARGRIPIRIQRRIDTLIAKREAAAKPQP